MPWTLHKIPKVGLALSLVTFIVIVFVLISHTKTTNNTAYQLAHTQEVLLHSEKMFAMITEAETSPGDYLITGQYYFLKAFETSKNKFTWAMDTLRRLTEDDSSQQKGIYTLLSIVSARISFWDSKIPLQKYLARDSALQLVAESKSDLYLDNIRQVTGKMQAEGNNLLQMSKKAFKNAVSAGHFVSLTIIFFMLVLLAFLFGKEKQLIAKELQWKSGFIFRSLVESAPDAMILVNEKGEIVLVNRQAEKMFGYTNEVLTGIQVETLMPSNFHKNLFIYRSNYFAHLMARSVGERIELYALRKDGTRFPIEIYLSPLITRDGKLIAASVRDITERKKREHNLINLNKDLAFQNLEKEKRITKLIIVTKDLAIENDEKEKQATEFLVAIKNFKKQNKY